jgi:hypothetical protein
MMGSAVRTAEILNPPPRRKRTRKVESKLHAFFEKVEKGENSKTGNEVDKRVD